MKNHCTFDVTGRGVFPLDMLRHDRAYPASTSSALAIAPGDERYLRTVLLHSEGAPTVERWRSFGWTVTYCSRIEGGVPVYVYEVRGFTPGKPAEVFYVGTNDEAAREQYDWVADEHRRCLVVELTCNGVLVDSTTVQQRP